MQPENNNWQPPKYQSNDAPQPVVPPTIVPDESPEIAAVGVTDTTPTPAMQGQPISADPTIDTGEDEVVRWQAAEYIYREKNRVWYVLFVVVVLALIALAIFVFRSSTFAILIPVMAAALVIYSHRAPTQLDYTLSRKGLHIDDKLYAYEQFKEFGLIHGDDQFSVMLVPRERFKPGVTVYFPEEVGEPIVDMLAARLPMHDIKLDPIDRFIRMLKI